MIATVTPTAMLTGAASKPKKFIPNGDFEFAEMARAFADTIAKDPDRWTLSDFDTEMLTRRVREFEEARRVAIDRGQRTPCAIGHKAERRRQAEEIVRRLANVIRASDQISAADKLLLGIKERPKKLGKRTLPFVAPYLSYEGMPRGAGANCGLHLLSFTVPHLTAGQSKPTGAVRIELFTDLVWPGDPVPEFPGQYLGGRPWYLNSYTSSPMKVEHPVPPVPMLVVYWARWADARCNVGPFSQTCVARVEGGWAAGGAQVDKQFTVTPADVKQLANDPKYITTITQLRQIEQVRVEPLLADGRAGDGAAGRRELEGPRQDPSRQSEAA